MKHTPGPWKLDREAVYGYDIRSVEENKWLGCTYKDRTHPSFVQDAEAEANALLIAAAPELLEALKKMTAFCDAHVRFVDVEPLLEAAAEAIAKAEAK